VAQKAKLRVISGTFKGLNISFSPTELLRPTPQRTKETLFNWLQLYIKDSRCLDLFAGTGNLGLEALSRGAKEIIFVDQDKNLLKSISALIKQLDADKKTKTLAIDSLKYLKGSKGEYDIIFLDAPFNTDLNKQSLSLIEKRELLSENGFIYYEHDKKLIDEEISPFCITKYQKTGQVHSYLLELNK
jgi:16S rRNA (guanine966-N2)-methyltransferase